MTAIEEADAFKLPDMTAGAEYVYNSLYKRLSCGEELKLSEINFSRFELDDVDTMRELYSDVLEANESRADALAHKLCGIPPVVAAAAFV